MNYDHESVLVCEVLEENTHKSTEYTAFVSLSPGQLLAGIQADGGALLLRAHHHIDDHKSHPNRIVEVRIRQQKQLRTTDPEYRMEVQLCCHTVKLEILCLTGNCTSFWFWSSPGM